MSGVYASVVGVRPFCNHAAEIYLVVCRVRYDYQGYRFTQYVGYGQPQAAYVDPADPALHMSQVRFDDGPESTTGDLIIAGALIMGSLGVGVLHELHRRHRRRAGPMEQPEMT